MRLFFGLPIDSLLSKDIVAWRDRAMVSDTKWVSMANYHITLAFFGHANEDQYRCLVEGCDEIFAERSFSKGTIKLDQTGFWSKPGILWIGPQDWSDNFGRLQKKLASLSQRCGAKRDKKTFQPHVTLSRKCILPPKPIIEPAFNLNYDQVILYESLSTRNGIQYRECAYWGLS